MDYRRLGRTNLKVSALGLGAMGFGDKAWRGWVLEREETVPIVRRALDLGINFFDTCDFYSSGRSEEILRETLLADAPRDSVVVATKVGNPMAKHPNARGYSRKHILNAAEASLRRLGTDYIDLYQTHIWDRDSDLEELVRAFDDLVRSGKVRYVGATTMPAWSFCSALFIARELGCHRFVSMQCEYNPSHREAERELIPLCRAEQIGLVPFSPIARGFLSADRRNASSARTETDDYTKKIYWRPSDHAVYEVIAGLAEARGASPSQVATAWTAARPGITAPIFGATKPAHVDEAAAALSLKLSGEEIKAIEAAYSPRDIDASGH